MGARPMTRRILLFAVCACVPGGFVIGASLLAYKALKRRKARRECEAIVRSQLQGWGRQIWGET